MKHLIISLMDVVPERNKALSAVQSGGILSSHGDAKGKKANINCFAGMGPANRWVISYENLSYFSFVSGLRKPVFS